jgi:hypothetical protein
MALASLMVRGSPVARSGPPPPSLRHLDQDDITERRFRTRKGGKNVYRKWMAEPKKLFVLVS